MSLSTGGGPLGANRFGRFTSPVPDELVYIEPHPRRIQAILDGEVVIDTESAQLMHRPGRTLTYLFPEALFDGPAALLPHPPAPEAPGFATVPWDAVDAWIEEGRRLRHYPPNPYHRIDCHPTRRRLRVEVGGVVLVDTDDTLIMFETSLAPKLYVAPKHVRTDLLRTTDTSTYCNYKGDATWWAAEIDGEIVADVAWSYEDPLPESQPIARMLSFDPETASVHAELPRPDVDDSGSER